MAVEDPSTYTVGGAQAARISTTSTRATATNLDRDDEAYCYDDKGAGHFNGNFEHLATNYLDRAENLAVSLTWALADGIGSRDDLESAGNKYLAIQLYRDSGGTYFHKLLEFDGTTRYVDNYVCSVDTPYYDTIARSGSTLTCKIYSDAARTNLLDTLTLTLQAVETYRYVYFITSRNAATGTVEIDCYLENLDLQEVVVAVVPLKWTPHAAL